MITGFLLGIVEDSFRPLSFGVNAFVNVLVGFVAGLVGERVFHHTLAIMFLLITGLKYASDLLLALYGWTEGQGGLSSQFLIFSPLSSIFTAAAGLLFLVAVRLIEKSRLGDAQGSA